MKKTKITAILAGGLLASTYSASAALSSVLAYDADGGTGSGTAGTLANGTSIVDQSTGGNNGITTNGVSGSGTGEVGTVEDDPNGVAGELSFDFDGSSARIVTTAIDLLTDDAIALNGGYTISTWIKMGVSSNGGTHSLITFAGTDGLTITGGSLSVIDTRGNLAFTGPNLADGLWHNITVAIDTSADPDGTANSTPGGPGGGVHGLEGVLSMTVDGVAIDTSGAGTITIGDFGDSLDRTISVGGHPQGFGTTEFTGQLYNPSVSLGVVPEPSSTALLGLGGLALILRRRK